MNAIFCQKVLFTTFLEQHGCAVEDRGEFLRVRFPEDTRREATLSGRNERHSITLPDGTHLVEVYIRQREYTILTPWPRKRGRHTDAASRAPTRNGAIRSLHARSSQ